MKEKPGSEREDPRRMLEVKIGAFVVLILGLGTAVVFLLGEKKHVFEERVTLHARFKNVAGLRDGAPVLLSGVHVGTVAKIAFAQEGGRSFVQVDLEIARTFLDRIRKDSVARVGAQGLLGDKLVEIALGSSTTPAMQPKEWIETQDSVDLNKVVEEVTHVIDRAKIVADNAANFMQGLGDAKSVNSIRSSLFSLRKILQAVEEGPGVTHWLIYDKQSAERADQVTARLADIATEVNNIAHRFDGAMKEIHDLHLIPQITRAAESVGGTVAELRQSKIIPHLEQSSRDLADITAFVKSGRGSLGGMIADPTIYHQLVAIVGGVERSRILRAIVRYAISKDDGQQTGRVIEPIPPEKLQGSAAVKSVTSPK